MSFRAAHWRSAFAFVLFGAALHAQTRRPPLTIDDLFSYTQISSGKLAPDGSAAVIATSRPDWKHDRFRDDLWLWREAQNSLLPLAQSGHDGDPQWSPNGKYIAFISSRPVLAEAPEESKNTEDTKADADKEIGRVWVISVNGGDAFPLYTDRLKTHTFAWSADSTAILFSAPEPLSKPKQEAERREWKDVARWREQERGDLLLEIPLKDAVPAPKPFSIIETATPKRKTMLLTTAPARPKLFLNAPASSRAANTLSGKLQYLGPVAISPF